MARIALAHFEPLVSERLVSRLRLRAHSVCAIPPSGASADWIERLSLDLLIIGASSNIPDVKAMLHEAVQVRQESGLRPMILCVLRHDKSARYQYELERRGIRVLYSQDIEQVLRAADLILFELARVVHDGPGISIVHRYRFHVDGAQCQAGEEIARIVASYQGRQAILPLSLATRLFFDYLARTKHTPQSAVQIVGHMRLHPFYMLHGMNCGIPSTRKISRTSVKQYSKRIREALGIAFDEISLPLDPQVVLVTQLAGNEARYVLKASVEWIHVDDLEGSPSRIRRAA